MMQWYFPLVNGNDYNFHIKLYTGVGFRYIFTDRIELAKKTGTSASSIDANDYHESPILTSEIQKLPTIHIGAKIGFMKL